MEARAISTRCCIVGAGPCGLMLGFLLARAGVDVVVLEKHGDFLRDFRGDIIHPSTLESIHEVGLLDQFLELPHQRMAVVSEHFGSREYTFMDFRHLPTRAKFMALMPQWDFLSFLAEQPEAFVRRRHRALQLEGLANPEIFARLTAELARWRFRAPAYTERQIRRIIYG